MATKKKTKDTAVQEPETIETPAPAQTEEVEQPTVKYKTGTVYGCVRLNVRDAASLKGKVLCEIEAGTKVKVDTANSTDEWYKVHTKDCIDGYCMKKYINIQ